MGRVVMLTGYSPASKHYFKKELRQVVECQQIARATASKHYFKKELRQWFTPENRPERIRLKALL